jgi:hypothetical protein
MGSGPALTPARAPLTSGRGSVSGKLTDTGADTAKDRWFQTPNAKAALMTVWLDCQIYDRIHYVSLSHWGLIFWDDWS